MNTREDGEERLLEVARGSCTVEADHVRNDGYTLTLMEIGAELASRATQVSALWSPTVFAPLSRLTQRGRCSSAATRAPTVLLVMCMQRWVVQYM